MPTSRPINTHTRVSLELEKDLAQYGLLRAEVMENAAPKEDEANFFGIRYEGEKPVLAFDIGVQEIERREMDIGMAVPEDKPFNLLVTENFEEAVKKASPSDLRTYLRRIVDRVRI